MAFTGVTNAHGPSPPANSMQVSIIQFDNFNWWLLVLSLTYMEVKAPLFIW